MCRPEVTLTIGPRITSASTSGPAIRPSRVFDGEAVSVVANALGRDPDAVGGAHRRARAADRRPAGAAGRWTATRPTRAAEWKRLMGTADRLPFEAAGAALLPEELSAEVIASLLADVRDAAGFTPRAAVISTPALFELPQNHATTRAGRLAGLEEVVLIQEPIASAHRRRLAGRARGTWLVFDLGGGTLDVSLLETRGRPPARGRPRRRQLSGRQGHGRRAGRLGGGGARPAWRGRRAGRPRQRARAAGPRPAAGGVRASEDRAVACRRARRSCVSDPAGDGGGEHELEISRDELDVLMAPFVDRSLAAVRVLLAKNQRSAGDVARVVLVGGPTLMPGLRARVGEMFGGRIAAGVDPMTIVARGAALYAGSVGPGRDAGRARARAGRGSRRPHRAPIGDRRPGAVRGRPLPARPDSGPNACASNATTAGGPAPRRSCPRRGASSSRCASTAAGATVSACARSTAAAPRSRLASRTFAIVHGVSIGDPPLARAIGVARADDSTQIYFKKGTPLPARRTFAHQTIRPVAAGSDDDALAVPIVQGESVRAHRNRLIGMLHLRGVTRDLPPAAGSR